MITAEELSALTMGRDMDECSATEVVNWAWDTFRGDLLLSCGFAADDLVLVDMLFRIGAEVKIAVVDSGRLFPQTFDFIENVIDRYRIKPVFYFPDPERLRGYLAKNSPNAFRLNHSLRLECCEIRRHEPLRRALDGHKAWMAGLRRSQGAVRHTASKVAMDPVHDGIVKICPLADWSWEQVWAYAMEQNVPMHPLYEKGYMSIGCAPCTRPSPSGGERAGRWWWEKPELREDGIHASLKTNPKF